MKQSGRDCSNCGKTAPYKCVQCESPFCSVKCSREHKLVCTRGPTPVASDEPVAPVDSVPVDARYEEMWADRRVRELVQYEGVSKLLKLIVDISESPRLSGEQSTEGRQMVALKKIRELRKGGREANAAIEELVTLAYKLRTTNER